MKSPIEGNSFLHVTWRVAILLTVVLAISFTTGCAKKKRKGGAATDGLAGGVLIFTDDFERQAVGDQYTTRSKRWSIVDGWMHIQGDKNEGLWLNVPLPDRTRVEFDARSMTDDGDIKCEIFSAEQRHQTGYIAILGGWHNALSVLARKDEHGEDRMECDAKVTRGQTHHFVFVRTEGSLRWYVDGRLILAFADEDPLRGSFFGFNNWLTDIYFDNLTVYRL